MAFKSSQNDTADLHLIGLYTRYSSWTARVELLLEHFQIPYRATFFNFTTPTGRQTLQKVSPNAFVPVIETPIAGISKRVVVYDSLAIAEFLAESNPTLPLWPADPALRALARSAAAEMHSAFGALRGNFPTNFLGRYSGAVKIPPEAEKDIGRVLALWDSARALTKERLGMMDGGYLFGDFGIVDAFFWPVLWRFRSYGLPLDGASPLALEWMAKMWNDPVMKGLAKDYFRQSHNPDSAISHYDDVFAGQEGVKYEKFAEDWEFQVPK